MTYEPKRRVSVKVMFEVHAETPSESDEEELHRNIQNVFLVLVTSFQIGAVLEACLTEEELGRVKLSCHFTLDCLCECLFLFLLAFLSLGWSTRVFLPKITLCAGNCLLGLLSGQPQPAKRQAP